MSIITLTDAKAALNIPTDDTTNDVELQGYVDAITGAIEDYKHEIIEPREITEVQRLYGQGRIRLDSGPIISLTSITSVGGATTYDVADFYIVPDSRTLIPLDGGVFGDVVVVYQAGYTEIPPRYKQGALVVLQHVWSTQRGGPRGPVRSPADLVSTYSIPNKALEWLGRPNPVGL